MQTLESVIIALDELNLTQSLDLVSKVGDRVYAFKIHNMFDEFGRGIVRQLKDSGARRVWVDAKIHDIPNTTKRRVEALAKSGADIITVHASGGVAMMKAAVQAAGSAKIYAVTILTSIEEDTAWWNTHGITKAAVVRHLARYAKEAGVHGIVCSPKEVGSLATMDNNLLRGTELITPGVRSAGKENHDQKNVDTPLAAIIAGASRLVIGRQMTEAADPLAALQEIELEIAPALG